jgi:hypothetical protein
VQAKDLLSNVLSFFVPSDAQKGTQINNNDILEELKLCFSKTIDDQSMKNQMLYDSVFLILIHPDDYAKREPTLPFVVKNAINEFYGIIKKRKKEFGDKPFVPPTENWYFQFSPTEEFLDAKIEKGDLSINSTFSSLKNKGGNSAGGTLVLTMKPKLSILYETHNINSEALGGLVYVGKGAFSHQVDKNLNEVVELPRSEADGFAVLEYTLNFKAFQFPMTVPEIIISKKINGVVPQTNTLAIESDFLEVQHARIKLDPNNQQFYLAAFADTKINEKTVPLSQGGDVRWVQLDRKSTILLGLFSIKFQSQLAQ